MRGGGGKEEREKRERRGANGLVVVCSGAHRSVRARRAALRLSSLLLALGLG